MLTDDAAYSDVSDQILGNGGIELKADASFIRAICHFHFRKFDYPNMDAIVIAYNELLLYYAEALAEQSNLDEAIKWLNKIEERAYGSARTTVAEGKEKIIQAIRKERRLELALQGERLFELKRIKAADIRGDQWDSAQLLFQIPDTEQNGNPDIERN
ncbi:MAG: RagB/SusD family nutrient uptake outer membrane protein [Tannerellaceae bacterium]|jgi:hypothetical protein|nr:RagB/SusD family nutrient uptake outer membrane protein [Tannerellaceae bacterium]